MIFAFKNILDAELYNNTSVIFILGKYSFFNNMVSDTLKQYCYSEESINFSHDLEKEFNIQQQDSSEPISSVDFNTFLSVVNVKNINGKWFCKIDLSSISKKQKEKLNSYIKKANSNGILVVESNDWNVYKEYLKNRALIVSRTSHVIQLNFPNKPILKKIITQYFNENEIDITAQAVDLFMIRMSSSYDMFEDMMNSIIDKHGKGKLDSNDMKNYMKGVENFVIDDFLYELTKPLTNDKANNKKIIRMQAMLANELTSKTLVYQLLKKVNELIEYRILINKGYIPIGINYFFKDIIDGLPDKEKYAKVNEWTFRKKASLASMTSLRDWEYIKLILSKAISNNKLSEEAIDYKCRRALYDISVRSTMHDNRINNIIGIDNIIYDRYKYVDKIMYNHNNNNMEVSK